MAELIIVLRQRTNPIWKLNSRLNDEAVVTGVTTTNTSSNRRYTNKVQVKMPNIEKALFDESLNKYLLDCDVIQVMQACLVEPDIPDKWFEENPELANIFFGKEPYPEVARICYGYPSTSNRAPSSIAPGFNLTGEPDSVKDDDVIVFEDGMHAFKIQ